MLPILFIHPLTSAVNIVRQETRRLATKQAVGPLYNAVDGLARRLGSFLDNEWIVHNRSAHESLEKRLKAVEKKLGIKSP